MAATTAHESMLESVTASQARHFGRLFDRAVRQDRPLKIVRWKRDVAILSSEALLRQLLERCIVHVNVIPEETGEFSLWVPELNVGAHGETLAEARGALLSAVRSYVQHYFVRWDVYRYVDETAEQLPYVMRLSLAEDDKDLARLLFGSVG